MDGFLQQFIYLCCFLYVLCNNYINQFVSPATKLIAMLRNSVQSKPDSEFLIIVVGLMCFETFTGSSIITSYAVYNFEKTRHYHELVSILCCIICTCYLLKILRYSAWRTVELNKFVKHFITELCDTTLTVDQTALSTFLYLNKSGFDLFAFSWIPVLLLPSSQQLAFFQYRRFNQSTSAILFS